MVEISEIFSTSSQSSLLQDPTVICVQKYFFSKIWYLSKKWQFWSVLGENVVKELKGITQAFYGVQIQFTCN